MFNSFDTNIIFNIFEKLDSWSVLSACMISTRSNRLCKNKDVVRRLLDAHYPNAHYTDDPWRQYVALASIIYTSYKTTIDSFCESGRYKGMSVFRLTNSYRSLDFYELHHLDIFNEFSRDKSTWIHGLPVPPGEKLWILYFENRDEMEMKSFKTEHAIAEWIVDNTYEKQLDGLIKKFYGHRPKNLNINGFIEMMRNHKARGLGDIHDKYIPFTKKNYYKSIINDISVYNWYTRVVERFSMENYHIPITSALIDMFYNSDRIYIYHIWF